MTPIYDVAVVGGGVVGAATALAVARRWHPTLVLLEAEDGLARHQSGRNSGVIHSGLYYPPGSLKARTCSAGREALYRFCREEGIAHRRTGKLVVATREEELPALAELARRGRANGLEDLAEVDAGGLAEIEPRAAGLAGLWAGDTGVVDFAAVTRALARRLTSAGGELQTGARVVGVRGRPGDLRLATTAGEVRCRYLVGCAGLESDRLARLAGVEPGVRIVPFRGDYYELRPERRHLVRGLIYPVPDPRLPFLGVHLTRTVEDRVEAGPNAVLSLSRRRYGRLAFSLRDAASALLYPGSWRLFRRFWRTGLAEMGRSLSRRAFARAVRRLVPEVEAGDLVRGGSGIRAQAVDGRGRMVDDFLVVAGEGSVHVVNAPSPAATAALAIGERVAEEAGRVFEWE